MFVHPSPLQGLKILCPVFLHHTINYFSSSPLMNLFNVMSWKSYKLYKRTRAVKRFPFLTREWNSEFSWWLWNYKFLQFLIPFVTFSTFRRNLFVQWIINFGVTSSPLPSKKQKQQEIWGSSNNRLKHSKKQRDTYTYFRTWVEETCISFSVVNKDRFFQEILTVV